ncbi:MAG: DinB family protein [Rhodospirillaceae bacterium]|nr:MAG: DinB family protein [Rhodospirillaceae bacterium]
MRKHYHTFASYNAWANRRLYEAAAGLDDAAYRADCGAFFKSMHGTLNHLVATDRIWMKRFTGQGDAPERLDAIVHDDFKELRAAREAEDARIVAWVGSLEETRLAGVIRYRRVSSPEEFVQELMPALDHWFNHQTHHRGHAHMILTSLGKAAPELDLLFYQREVAAGLDRP